MDIINKNSELSSINKQLTEENKNLINKNKELIEENNKIKEQINSKSSNNDELNKKIKENQSFNMNNKIEINNKNNISNNESNISNKEMIYSKKKESFNSPKFCSMDDFNKLKSTVEELKIKMNNLIQWKISFENKNAEKKEIKNINQENNIQEKIIKEVNEKKDNKDNNINNIIPKYIKKNIIDDKLQKIKNNFEADNSYSDESDGYSNARTVKNNHNSKKIDYATAKEDFKNILENDGKI